MPIIEFLSCIPGMIKLVEMIKKRLNEKKEERKAKDEIKKLHKAFEDNDLTRFNELFNKREN